eukprot:UN17387
MKIQKILGLDHETENNIKIHSDLKDLIQSLLKFKSADRASLEAADR